jgi:hypothetical protein
MLLVATYFAGFVTSQKLAEKALREAEEKAAAELQAARAAAENRLLIDRLILKGFSTANVTGLSDLTGVPDPDIGITVPPTTEYRYADPLVPQGAKGP